MNKVLLLAALLCSISTMSVLEVDACSRVTYKGKNNIAITARSMDWASGMGTNIWIFPRSIERDGRTGGNTLKWTAKYGSIVTTVYDIASPDGMNEKGLSVGMLWLNESIYPKWDGSKPGLSMSAWAQYLLDSFATVDEVVAAVGKEDFVVVTDNMPDSERIANIHLGISDSKGDNAIIEYIDGKLHIYHNMGYHVLTNSPSYDQQLSLNRYWKEIGGANVLPGTSRAADRFTRATHYLSVLPEMDDNDLALSTMLSVIRNVSVPLGAKAAPDTPNIASTLWRTVADQKNMVYYFDSPYYMNVIWFDLKDIDFSQKAGVRKLDLQDKNKRYEGNSVKYFKRSEPFKFMGLKGVE